MISFEVEQLLRDYFSGHFAALMGMRSPLGGQLERLRLGLLSHADGVVEPDERCMEAANVSRRVAAVLRAMEYSDNRTLRLYFTPSTPGEMAGLAMYGPWLRVVCGGHRARALRLASRARAKDLDALASVSSEIAKAMSSVEKSQETFERRWRL